ncbi:MAG: PAS domain-containing protein [Arcobacteraceae bacterium]
MNYNDTLLDSIMNIPNTLIYAVDTSYRYTSFSNQYIQSIQRDFEITPLIGMSILDVVKTDEHKARIEKNLNFALNNEYHTDYEVHNTSVVEIKYSPIKKDDEIIGVIAIKNVVINNYSKWFQHFSDIKIFESITNIIKAGVVLVDPFQKDMPLIFVNDTFVTMTGYSKEEAIGKNARFLQGDFVDQSPKTELKKALKAHKSCEVELKNFRKDGTPYYNLLNITPLFDDKGKLLYFIGIQFDITNSIEYRKVSTIKRLAEGLTHEINTAMSPIKGHMEMLQYDIEAIDDEKTKEYMLDSLRSIKKSKKIIEDISNSLHYFCCTSKQNDEKIGILETLELALKEFQDKINSNAINLELNILNDIKIDVEKEAIVHLWMILLDNAIDAVNENDTSKNINITVTKLDKKIEIIFQDNANGIHPDIQEDIFKALTKNKEYGGIGIGLFVAKAIVENNNGTITFTTSKEGTKFIVTLETI